MWRVPQLNVNNVVTNGRALISHLSVAFVHLVINYQPPMPEIDGMAWHGMAAVACMHVPPADLGPAARVKLAAHCNAARCWLCLEITSSLRHSVCVAEAGRCVQRCTRLSALFRIQSASPRSSQVLAADPGS